MAEEVSVWRANDGTFWTSQSQALAYEMKIYLINLGKSAQAVQIDPTTGKIDEAGMNFLAASAVSAMTQTAATLTAAITPAMAATVAGA